MRTIRWGLLGAGVILDRWMRGAAQFGAEDMQIVAIASRTMRSAEKAAAKFHISEVQTVEQMLDRQDIDVVYIPVPHTVHHDFAIRAMEAGKSVLVEKPAAINASQFNEMTDCAKEHSVFLMEAVWTLLFPTSRLLLIYLGDDGIGKVRAISSNFSFRSDDVTSRLFDPERAGGSLLDVGVYNLHFAQMIMRKCPAILKGICSMDTDDLHLQVEEQSAYIAQYDNGELAMMCSAVRTEMNGTAYIYGTKGYIAIPHFWRPTIAKVTFNGDSITIGEEVPQMVPGIEDEGFQFEIAHVNDCLRKGLKQSPIVTWEKTRNVLKQCDSLRNDWGIKYPQELI